jgi:hypothetical protein
VTEGAKEAEEAPITYFVPGPLRPASLREPQQDLSCCRKWALEIPKLRGFPVRALIAHANNLDDAESQARVLPIFRSVLCRLARRALFSRAGIRRVYGTVSSWPDECDFSKTSDTKWNMCGELIEKKLDDIIIGSYIGVSFPDKPSCDPTPEPPPVTNATLPSNSFIK